MSSKGRKDHTQRAARVQQLRREQKRKERRRALLIYSVTAAAVLLIVGGVAVSLIRTEANKPDLAAVKSYKVTPEQLEAHLREIRDHLSQIPLQVEGRRRTTPKDVAKVIDQLEQRLALIPLLRRFAEKGRGVLVYLRDGTAGVPLKSVNEEGAEAVRARQWREVGLGARAPQLFDAQAHSSTCMPSSITRSAGPKRAGSFDRAKSSRTASSTSVMRSSTWVTPATLAPVEMPPGMPSTRARSRDVSKAVWFPTVTTSS